MEPRRSSVLFLLRELFREISSFIPRNLPILRKPYLLHSLRFEAVSDRCHYATFLNVAAQWVFGFPVPVLPVLTFHIDVACASLRWSIDDYMTSPSPLQTVSQCREVLQGGSLLYFSTHKTVILPVLSNVCEFWPQHIKGRWRTSIYFGQETKRVVRISQEEGNM
jgi:hypothetical protein